MLLTCFMLASIFIFSPNKAFAADYSVQQWKTVEISLTSSKTYADPFNNVDVTATFTGPGGVTIVRPAYWSGGTNWRIRFAPTVTGAWTMTTVSTDTTDAGLHNISKSIDVTAYTGNQEIYQRGFLKVSSNGKYFTYADGTPFFYLGDTHWIMPHERFTTSNAPGVDSQFKYVVDKRVAQGFTVYQSEPIWAPHGGGTHSGADEEAIANLSDGFTSADLAGFDNLDRKFQYVADQGLVHANAQVAWALEPKYSPTVYTDAYMEKIAKYWIARYGSYPVIWTIAQEIDANMYGNYNSTTMSKWYSVGQSLANNDAYGQPIMPHMEDASYTTANNSSWATMSYHDGFGVQWQGEMTDMNIAKSFWNYSSSRPAVLYETGYEGFWLNSTEALANGYKAFQYGMYGYGYGVAGVWNDVYSRPGESNDAGTGYQLADHYGWWYDGANVQTGDQLTYLKNFYKSIEWWKLVPRFDNTSWGAFNDGARSLLSSDGSSTYVVFFFNSGTATGTLKQMDNSYFYRARWYNPRTGVYSTISNHVAPSSGQWTMPNKPDGNNWVLLVEKNVNTTTTAAMPNASPFSSEFNGTLQVNLTTPTSGATIRYTTDGSTPSGSSTLYTGSISIHSNTVIKAIALKSGLTNSPIMTETYTVSGNLGLNKKYASSSNWDANQTAAKAFDGNPTTNWQACYGCWSGQWLEVDFGSNKTFNKVTLSEYGNRIQDYQIQYWNGSIWLTAYTGKLMGSSRTITFNSVTGSKARLYITAGSGAAPIIYSFDIYNDSAVTTNLAIGKTYSSSSNVDANQTAAKAFDASLGTNWQACAGCWNGQWLEVNFGVNTTFNKVVLNEYGGRTQGYRIEYWNGTAWQTAFTGTVIGANWRSRAITFNAVTGSKARVYFTSGTADAPIIYEVEIYNDPSVTTNLAIGKSFSSSSNWDANQTAAKAFDASLGTNWQACSGCWSGQWLEVNFGTNTTFNQVAITEYGNRTQGFRIEYWNGSAWLPAYVGSTIGGNWNPAVFDFAAVTGSKARIYFTAGTADAPIIYEFSLYQK